MDGFRNLFVHHFRTVLKEIRKNQKWTQEELAYRCDISSREYNDLELGKRLPSAESLAKMVVGVDLDFNEIIQRMLEDGYIIEPK